MAEFTGNPKKEEMKIMLWNIEGIKSAMNMAPVDFLRGYDATILTETFLTDQWQHEDYYCTHLLAEQGERGRPKGGITVLLKPWLTPITLTTKQDHTLLIETKYLTIISAYFQPNTTAMDIIDELSQLITQSKQDRPLIIAGDLNCRIDAENFKTKMVIEKLQEEGFRLLNNSNVPTYIGHNGKSAIDIALIRGPIKGKISPLWEAQHTPIRKHLPMEIKLHGKWRVTKPRAKQQLSRKIDVEKVEGKSEKIEIIDTFIEESKLEEAVHALEELLIQATSPRKKRRSKQWFDQECYMLRKEVIETLHQLKSNIQNHTLLQTYNGKRRHYKRLVKEKKRIYWEEEGKRLAEDARKDPYIAIRPRKQAQTNYINMEEWHTHMSNILNKEGILITTQNSQENDTQLSTEWTPLSITEIQNTIVGVKSKKAAGPDMIYGEYIKDSAHLLMPIWTKLYNKCVETASIPERWRHSTIKMLYKGKGDPTDINKYRGIALENIAFKIFSKIISQRIQETVDEHLPETQFGFRKGRSTIMAIELLLNNIWDALEGNEKFYVVFIDFTKAFDLINRKLVIKKLEETLGKNNIWTKLLTSILKWNKIRISDNLSISQPILQTNGVTQGDPLSPLLFILATEELMRITEREDIVSYAYADDIAVGSKDLTKLQCTINDMEEWCAKHEFQINTEKTEMMVFRKGGRVPTSAEIIINRRKINIAKEYKYLGLTLQTSAKIYTKHITDKATQAARAIHEITHIRALSLETAMTLFGCKIVPILTYGIEIIWPHLTEKNLAALERIKALYIKRAIGVAKTTRSRLVYLLARETFLIEDLRTRLQLPNTRASENLLTSLNTKREEIPQDFYGTGAMIDRSWTAANFEMRHVLTRLAVHGFHHAICKNTSYHEAAETCECKLCGLKCERYHIELCKKRTKSIVNYASA